MQRNTKITIAIVSAVVLLAVIIFIVWWLNRGTSESLVVTPPTNESNIVPPVLPSASAGATEEVMNAEEQNLQSVLTAIAFTFAERFGSYSTESNFSNLTALESLMTVKMKTVAETFKNTQQATTPGTFYGVSTQALSATIHTIDQLAGRASLTVSTQRQESRGDTTNPRVFYQDLDLELALVGDQWKIDTASWK